MKKTEELKHKAKLKAIEFVQTIDKYFEGDDYKRELAMNVFADGYETGAIENGIQWHEIESKVSPKREISKQYMPKNKEKVLLKYHFSGDDEIHISDGYYDAYDFEFHIANNPKHRIVCVIAWCENPTV